MYESRSMFHVVAALDGAHGDLYEDVRAQLSALLVAAREMSK
ncbi:hypothetical protein [Candidatus Palauibacter sp.]